MTKARVAALKQTWTTPRLELLGAVIAARVASRIKSYLGNQSIHLVKFWCDSSAILRWIRDAPHTWKAFVANRVTEIQFLSDKKQWNYICPRKNPADIFSRGITLDTAELKRFWLSDPSWLSTTSKPSKSHTLNASNKIDSDVAIERIFYCTLDE